MEAVELTARRISGSGGPSETDSQNLQGWLLRFGPISKRLLKAVADLTEWMGTEEIPWAAYRGLMAGRLVALDKCPGVRSVGIGEVWRRLVAKIVLVVAGEDATVACGTDQLCAGLSAGVEGGIRAAQVLRDSHSQEEEWGFSSLTRQMFSMRSADNTCCGW